MSKISSNKKSGLSGPSKTSPANAMSVIDDMLLKKKSGPIHLIAQGLSEIAFHNGSTNDRAHFQNEIEEDLYQAMKLVKERLEKKKKKKREEEKEKKKEEER